MTKETPSAAIAAIREALEKLSAEAPTTAYTGSPEVAAYMRACSPDRIALLLEHVEALTGALTNLCRNFQTDEDMHSAGWAKAEINAACDAYDAARAALAAQEQKP